MKKTIALVCAAALAVSTVSVVAQDTGSTSPQIPAEVVAQNVTNAPADESAMPLLVGLAFLAFIAAAAGSSNSAPMGYVALGGIGN